MRSSVSTYWRIMQGANGCVRVYGLLLVMCFMIVCRTSASAQHTDIRELRNLYYRSYKEKKQAELLHEQLANVSITNPLYYGYKAISSIMLCNHVNNPYTKLKYFYTGKNQLEAAIKSMSTDPELRYLRFAVQCNAPAVLNYNDNIREDKKILLDYIGSKRHQSDDEDLYKRICDYLSTSKALTAAERAMAKNTGTNKG